VTESICAPASTKGRSNAKNVFIQYSRVAGTASSVADFPRTAHCRGDVVPGVAESRINRPMNWQVLVTVLLPWGALIALIIFDATRDPRDW
jgi:hypothetical protein